VLCTGNTGAMQYFNWLKSLSANFHVTKGDFDEVRLIAN